MEIVAKVVDSKKGKTKTDKNYLKLFLSDESGETQMMIMAEDAGDHAGLRFPAEPLGVGGGFTANSVLF